MSKNNGGAGVGSALRRWRAFAMGGVSLLLAAGALAGCGGSSSGGSGGGKTSAEDLAAAKTFVEKAYAGTDGALPTSSPKPQPGKRLYILSCSQQAPGCANVANTVDSVAKQIGWETHILDGKLDASTYPGLIQSAIAAKADAIFDVSVDCSAAKNAFQQAHDAGIKIVAFAAFDCNDPLVEGGGDSLFDHVVSFVGGQSLGDFVQNSLGAAAANWTIAQTDGKAEVIEMREDDVLIVKAYALGFEKAIAHCGGCVVHKVEVSGADYANGGLLKKAQAALARYPNADVMLAPSDGALLLGPSTAIKQSGRDVKLIGLDGLSDTIEQIKAGGPAQMIPGLASNWSAWAAVDDINRLLNGEPLVDAGIGYQIVDHDHNIPTTTPGYDSNVDDQGKPKQDYQANYLKIWGVS